MMTPYLLILSLALLAVQALPAACWPDDPAPQAASALELVELQQMLAASEPGLSRDAWRQLRQDSLLGWQHRPH
ncbi:hypothetical protein ACW5XW_01065 [Aeromonas piscicola]|jgi:hypothetical protein